VMDTKFKGVIETLPGGGFRLVVLSNDEPNSRLFPKGHFVVEEIYACKDLFSLKTFAWRELRGRMGTPGFNKLWNTAERKTLT
jgi:hypothetical protein